MIIVDSHCHVSPVWYEPVETLLHQMDRHGVEHSILIQIQGQFNNDYQTECLSRFPGRFASVVVLDNDQADAVQRLEREVERGASGVRLRPGVRSPGDDPLAIWRAAARLGLSVSCGGTASDFASDEFAEIIRALPELKIVIEHLGSVNHPNDGDSPQHDIRRKVFELARFPNAYIKVPGLGEFARRALPVVEPFPFEQPIPPLLEMAYQTFGPQRMMWGSDYPPSSGREGYGNALRLPMEEFASKSEADRDLIFGGVALDVFPVRG